MFSAHSNDPLFDPWCNQGGEEHVVEAASAASPRSLAEFSRWMDLQLVALEEQFRDFWTIDSLSRSASSTRRCRL